MNMFHSSMEDIASTDEINKLMKDEDYYFPQESRYSCHLFTDKHIYQPGEKVFFTAFVLNTFSHRPCKNSNVFENNSIIATIKNLNGEVLMKSFVEIQKSVISFSWVVPIFQKGGIFECSLEPLIVQTPDFDIPFFNLSSRSFTVEHYKNIEYEKEFVMLKRMFDPGEEFKGVLFFRKKMGWIPDGAVVMVVVKLRSDEIFENKIPIKNQDLNQDDNDRDCVFISFKIPKKINGNLILKISIVENEYFSENIVMQLPISEYHEVINTRFYPESRQSFVEGIKNGVYFESCNLFGEQKDVEGVLIERNTVTNAKKIVFQIKSEHNGRGSFFFTPNKNCLYSVEITKPLLKNRKVHFPIVIQNGVTLRLKTKSACDFNDFIQFVLCSTRKVTVHISLYKKDYKIETKRILLSEKIEKTVGMSPQQHDGCLNVVVTNFKGSLICERVIFVKPRDKIIYSVNSNITTKVNNNEFNCVPEETVKLVIKSRSKLTTLPIKSISCVVVTNEEKICKNTPNLMEMHYLEDEILSLDKGNSFFETDNKKKDTEIDLLMGVQSWRKNLWDQFFRKRFDIFKDYEKKDHEKLYRFFNIANMEKNSELCDLMKEISELDELLRSKKEDLNRLSEKKKSLKFSFKKKKKSPVIKNSKKKGEKKDEKSRKLKRIKKKSFKKYKEKKVIDIRELKEVFVGESSETPNSVKLKGEFFDIEIDSKKIFKLKKKAKKKMRLQMEIEAIKEELALKKGELFQSKKAFEGTYSYQSSQKPCDTVYFTPFQIMDGELKVEFDVSPQNKRYKVSIIGFNRDGVMGFSTYFINVLNQLSFKLKNSIPKRLCFSDKIILIGNITNNIFEKIKYRVNFQNEDCVKMKLISGKSVDCFELPQRKSCFKFFDLSIKKEFYPGRSDIKIMCENVGKDFVETYKKRVKFFSYGISNDIIFSGRINSSKIGEIRFKIEKGFKKKSLRTHGFLSSTLLSLLLNSMRRYKKDCCMFFLYFLFSIVFFENKCSQTFTAILIKKFINRQKEKINLNFFHEVNKYLSRSKNIFFFFKTELDLKNLMEHYLESSGFFQKNLSTELLSSFGYYILEELKEVYYFNEEILHNVKKWVLLLKRDGKLFKNEKVLFILWILSCKKTLTKEIKFEDVEEILKKKLSNESNNLYSVALIGLIYFNFDKIKESKETVNLFVDKQNDNGSFGEELSIKDLNLNSKNCQVEVTALCLLNIMNFKEDYVKNVEIGVDFILSCYNPVNGLFCNHQANFLCNHIISILIEQENPLNDVEVDIALNKEVIQQIRIKNEISIEPIPFFVEEKVLLNQPNTVEIFNKSQRRVFYSLTVFSKIQKDRKEKFPINITCALSEKSLKLEQTTTLEIKLKNVTDTILNNVVVAIFLPSGLQLEKIDEVKDKSDTEFKFKKNLNELQFFFKMLKKKEERILVIGVRAMFVGEFFGDSSNVIIEGNVQNMLYLKGLTVKINPK